MRTDPGIAFSDQDQEDKTLENTVISHFGRVFKCFVCLLKSHCSFPLFS